MMDHSTHGNEPLMMGGMMLMWVLLILALLIFIVLGSMGIVLLYRHFFSKKTDKNRAK